MHIANPQKFKSEEEPMEAEADIFEEEDRPYFSELDPEKYRAPKLSIELKEEKEEKSKMEARHKKMYSWHQMASRRRLSFGGSSRSQFEVQPLSHESYQEIYSKKSTLRQELHVFAFVWFFAKDSGSGSGQQNGYKLSERPLAAEKERNDDLSQSLLRSACIHSLCAAR